MSAMTIDELAGLHADLRGRRELLGPARLEAEQIGNLASESGPEGADELHRHWLACELRAARIEREADDLELQVGSAVLLGVDEVGSGSGQ